MLLGHRPLYCTISKRSKVLIWNPIHTFHWAYGHLLDQCRWKYFMECGIGYLLPVPRFDLWRKGMSAWAILVQCQDFLSVAGKCQNLVVFLRWARDLLPIGWSRADTAKIRRFLHQLFFLYLRKRQLRKSNGLKHHLRHVYCTGRPARVCATW